MDTLESVQIKAEQRDIEDTGRDKCGFSNYTTEGRTTTTVENGRTDDDGAVLR